MTRKSLCASASCCSRSAGYEVLTAASGEEGLEVFKQNSVDLVIADHFLSDKSGAEIAVEMKEIKPQVPILIVSAAAEAAQRSGFADGFLSKGDGPGRTARTALPTFFARKPTDSRISRTSLGSSLAAATVLARFAIAV